jgi:hypothetical protein
LADRPTQDISQAVGNHELIAGGVMGTKPPNQSEETWITDNLVDLAEGQISAVPVKSVLATRRVAPGRCRRLKDFIVRQRVGNLIGVVGPRDIKKGVKIITGASITHAMFPQGGIAMAFANQTTTR